MRNLALAAALDGFTDTDGEYDVFDLVDAALGNATPSDVLRALSSVMLRNIALLRAECSDRSPAVMKTIAIAAKLRTEADDLDAARTGDMSFETLAKWVANAPPEN